MSSIDPDRLYSFPEACKLIPSNRGESICPETLHAWRKSGRVLAECREVGGRKQWFIRGAEILLACLPRPEPAAQGTAPTPAAMARRRREAEHYLDSQGIK